MAEVISIVGVPGSKAQGISVIRMGSLCLGTLLTLGANLHAQDVKVAFIQAGDIGIANADGSGMHLLTHGEDASEVRWSADGRRLLYTSSSKNKNVLADIVVIAAENGKELNRIPILQMDTDGLGILNDMRFVESSGWVSDDVVYVSGSDHPHVPSIETFDLRKNKDIDTDYPDTFAACPAKRHFAEVKGLPREVKLYVLVDDRKAYAGNEDDDIYSLTWNFDCSELAFIDLVHGDDRHPAFFLSRENAIVQIPLPDNLVDATLVAVGHTFIARNMDGEYMEYDPAQRRFKPPSKAIQDFMAAKKRIEQTFRNLGGDGFIETWPDVLTVDIPKAQPGR